MTRFLTADLHIGHEVVAEKRGFKSLHKHDKALLNAYNDLVTDDDEVYIVGDLCMWSPEKRTQLDELVRKLKGKKHLILGNHDRFKPFTYVEAGIMTVHTALPLELEVKPSEVFPQLVRTLKVWLVHDPSVVTMDERIKWVCGHIHSLFTRIGTVMNVGVDVHNLKPLPEKEVVFKLAGTKPTPEQAGMKELAGKMRHDKEHVDKEEQ